MARSGPRIDLQAVLRVAELADYVIAFSIRAVCDLGIADALIEGPRQVAELAERSGAHAPTLYRVMRALASKGVFEELSDQRFGLSPLAQPLRSDHPMSLRDAYPLRAVDIQAWARFDHTLKTGEPAFGFVHGQSLWEYFATNREESARFDRGMAAVSRPELRAALAAYPWAELASVVDVGGGNGAFLAGLLARFEAMRGIVFDLEHVVAGAKAVLEDEGVAERCEVVAGSFFEALPRGHSAYVVKRILYSWDDDSVVAILRSVRDAMTASSKLLILEPVIVATSESTLAKLADVVMLAVDHGRARTPEELAELLGRAGLALSRVIPTFMFPIVEATISPAAPR